MALTIPVTFVDGQTLTGQQLNSVNSAIAAAVNDLEDDVSDNTTNIASNLAKINKIGSHCFFATAGSETQSVSSTSITTVEIGTEVVDQGSAYDSSSTYKFVPDLAGRYILSAGVYISSFSGTGTVTLYITKNTTNYTIGKTGSDESWIGGTVVLLSDGNDEFFVRVKSSDDAAYVVENAIFSGFLAFPS